MPGTRITDEDRRKIGRKFICTSCDLLLSTPMQTSCGHLMCASCVDVLLESSNPRCPDDGTELTKDQVFPDAFTKRELRALSLHCANPGCRWHGTYVELEAHSLVCEHAQINCAKCKKNFQRSHLSEHSKNECEYRNVKCNHCYKDIPFASLKDHVTTSCEGAPVTCKFCKQKVLRRDLERHEQVVCEEVPGECEFQAVGCNHDKTLKRRELRQHMNDGLIDHVRFLLQFFLNLLSQLGTYVPRPEFAGIIQKIRDDISEVRSGLAEKFVMLVGKLTGLERRIEGLEAGGGHGRGSDEIRELRASIQSMTTEINSLAEKVRSLERELREKDAQIDRMRSRMDQIDESLALNTVKITDLESQRGPRAQQLIHSYNGTLLWKIDNYQRKRQDAINGVKTALYSPHFYSAQYGYKLCAKIYMNGDGFGKGSHLSLFFVVMRGDYDSLQTWPFQKKITMMLLDQGNGDHMVDAFHSDPQSSSFQRPKSDMNIASGSPLFMPIDSLSNRQYIKDDVMFIKIIVD
ncbi:TNF receptor-associated factor 3-like [Dendronephthya gigantea]|uniref:TNF receptor-associated factor 3-like n=1 Tax=Dendronephthya gigantea TaxID=151771 RepID=UPI00106BB717|nr:TNF receptor-associated factor 3-like [Dendronephthya gigantea]XP_028415917.1 TNF receptor-associated factor 3-like [Dendronephthya gigantea]XP_028415918.1 TNF receptor-associated factor 3-like [Dendronephthya gigantea]XP_028415919.1 TNF receptor-associated factor 3-like [Dendronephthya gigantea]